MKDEIIMFIDFILNDYEMGEFEDSRSEDLCWVLAGTNQKYTSKELYELYLETIIDKL